MYHDQINYLREKLNVRFRELYNEENMRVFKANLERFWRFLVDDSTFLGLIETLEAKFPTFESEASRLREGSDFFVGKTDEEHTAFAIYVIKSVLILRMAC